MNLIFAFCKIRAIAQKKFYGISLNSCKIDRFVIQIIKKIEYGKPKLDRI